MKCNTCKIGHLEVLDSRQSSKWIRRRRKCKECGKRSTTYEITVDRIKHLNEIEERLSSLLLEPRIMTRLESAAHAHHLENSDKPWRGDDFKFTRMRAALTALISDPRTSEAVRAELREILDES